MKQGLIILTMLFTLGMSVPAVAQKHRHTPRETELVDTTMQASAVDAYSDTTSVDSGTTHSVTIDWNGDDGEDIDKAFEAMEKVLDKFGNSSLSWLAWVVAVLIVIFVFLLILSPFIFILLLIYLINRNRKQKMKLAQMAMQNGQPIPEQLIETPKEEVTDEYQKGLRQCFVGIGLAVFLWIAADEIGLGIGLLVFFIGLGKVVAAKTAAKNKDLNNNDLIQQDYD